MPTDFSYDDVACSGIESTLNDCNHDNIENCDGSEGAGVRCKAPGVTTTTRTTTTTAITTTSDPIPGIRVALLIAQILRAAEFAQQTLIKNVLYLRLQ